MSEVSSHLTIARNGEAVIEVRGSRFRCTLDRVGTEADARAVVERVRREHRDARHHCSAFRTRPAVPGRSTVERSSDDGEPAGTAGAPMLEVLRGHQGAGIVDVVAVVSRWFGGTLLGAGGLVRAYGDAVRAALDEVGTLRRALLGEYALEVSHADAGRLESELRALGVAVLDAVYGGEVRLLLGIPPDAAEDIAATVAALTAGTAGLERIGEHWTDPR